MIELRARTEAHVRICFEKTQDSEIASSLPQTAQTVEQALENYQKSMLPGATSYGRTIYADGAYVGDIWCYCIGLEEEPNAMLSWCVFEKILWNRGIATQALKLFLEDIVPRFGLKSVGAFAYCSNGASLRVMEKNGFLQMETFFEEGIESVYCQKETV